MLEENDTVPEAASQPPEEKHVKLSPAVAKNALPAKTDYILWDTANAGMGFGLRVHPSGKKSWIVQQKQNGRPVRVTIDHFPTITMLAALKEAQLINSEFSRGLNPNQEKKKRLQAAKAEQAKASLTVEVAFTAYQESRKEGAERTNLDREKAKKLMSTGPLWTMPLLEVTGHNLQAEYKRLVSRAKPNGKKLSNGGKTQASIVMRLLRAAFNHAFTTRQLSVIDPFKLFNHLEPRWSTARARQRIVAEDSGQLQRWWAAVEQLRVKDQNGEKKDGRKRHANTIADYLQLSLLFGSRKSEILPLPWENVDLENGVITFKQTKNGKDHIVPYGEYAREVIERRWELNKTAARKSEYVFPSNRKKMDGTYSHIQQPQENVDFVINESGIAFSPHDLRRTFATLASEIEQITTTTLESVLNHAPTTTARKHYINSRMTHLRPLYQRLEDAILIEAGVKDTSKDAASEVAAALVEIRAAVVADRAAVAALQAAKAAATSAPETLGEIQLGEDNGKFVASIVINGRTIKATGDTPKRARELLELSL